MKGIPNYKKYPAVGFPMCVIVWTDSHEPGGRNSEITPQDFPGIVDMVYVGMVIDETDTEITMAEGYTPDDKTFAYVISIPKVAIVSRRRIYFRKQSLELETSSDGDT